MNAVLQIARKRIWWILLALVILGVLFFRPSILGFREGATVRQIEPMEKKKGKKVKKVKKGANPAGKNNGAYPIN